MASSTFDTLGAARELEAKGIGSDQAEAIVNAIRQSAGDQITTGRFDARFSEQEANIDKRLTEIRAHIDTGLAQQNAILYRALLIQGAAVVGVLAGLYTLVGGG